MNNITKLVSKSVRLTKFIEISTILLKYFVKFYRNKLIWVPPWLFPLLYTKRNYSLEAVTRKIIITSKGKFCQKGPGLVPNCSMNFVFLRKRKNITQNLCWISTQNFKVTFFYFRILLIMTAFSPAKVCSLPLMIWKTSLMILVTKRILG